MIFRGLVLPSCSSIFASKMYTCAKIDIKFSMNSVNNVEQPSSFALDLNFIDSYSYVVAKELGRVNMRALWQAFLPNSGRSL